MCTYRFYDDDYDKKSNEKTALHHAVFFMCTSLYTINDTSKLIKCHTQPCITISVY